MSKLSTCYRQIAGLASLMYTIRVRLERQRKNSVAMIGSECSISSTRINTLPCQFLR